MLTIVCVRGDRYGRQRRRVREVAGGGREGRGEGRDYVRAGEAGAACGRGERDL